MFICFCPNHSNRYAMENDMLCAFLINLFPKFKTKLKEIKIIRM